MTEEKQDDNQKNTWRTGWQHMVRESLQHDFKARIVSDVEVPRVDYQKLSGLLVFSIY